MTKLDLENFSNHIEIKYIDILQEIHLEYVDSDKGQYINFNVLKIKEQYRNIGFGSKILSETCKFANKQNVRIKLLPTCLFGSDIERLMNLCFKYGFIRIVDEMIYLPVKENRRLPKVQINN